MRSAAQPICSRITTWATKNGILLSSKSFARILGAKEGATEPPLTMGDIKLDVVVAPFKLVGILHPVSAQIAATVKHLTDVGHRIAAISKALPPLSLRELYVGAGLGRVLFALHTWWPFVPVHQKAELEGLHALAAKKVLGIISSANSATALAEAGLRSLDYYATKKAIEAMEWQARMPPTPASAIFTRVEPPNHAHYRGQVTTDSIVSYARRHTVPELVGLAVMDALPRDPIEPELLQFAHRVHIAPLPTERVLRTAGALERAAYNECTMKRCDATVQIWTDGSSKTDEEFPLGTGACGAIAFVDGRPGDVLLHNVGTPYTAEEAGVLLGARLAAASTAAAVGIFSTASRSNHCWHLAQSVSALPLALTFGELCS